MAMQIKTVIDGKEEINTVKPGHLLAQERAIKNGDIEDDTLEAHLWLAWASAGRPGDFEKWVDTLDDLEVIGVNIPTGDAGDEVPPTTSASRGSRRAQA